MARGRPLHTPALVLRKTRLGDHDLIVTLLGRDTGRLSAVARGARRSFRRFGGALEIGTRLEARVVLRPNRDLHDLSGCDVTHPLRDILGDLDRIQHLAHALEIARIATHEGAADPDLFELVVAYVEVLEAAPASDEALVRWQLAMLARLGFGLSLGPCVISGGVADAISLDGGGTVRRARCSHRDVQPLPPAVLAALARLQRGDLAARLPVEALPQVRRVFGRIWYQVTGRRLRTTPVLN